MHTKGASEQVLEWCTKYHTKSGDIIHIDKAQKD
jgi:hypothetical protein